MVAGRAIEELAKELEEARVRAMIQCGRDAEEIMKVFPDLTIESGSPRTAPLAPHHSDRSSSFESFASSSDISAGALDSSAISGNCGAGLRRFWAGTSCGASLHL